LYIRAAGTSAAWLGATGAVAHPLIDTATAIPKIILFIISSSLSGKQYFILQLELGRIQVTTPAQ